MITAALIHLCIHELPIALCAFCAYMAANRKKPDSDVDED